MFENDNCVVCDKPIGREKKDGEFDVEIVVKIGTIGTHLIPGFDTSFVEPKTITTRMCCDCVNKQVLPEKLYLAITQLITDFSNKIKGNFSLLEKMGK